MAKYEDEEFELDSDLLLDEELTLDNIPTSEMDQQDQQSLLQSSKPMVNSSLHNLLSTYGPEITNLLINELGKSKVHLRHLASITDEDLIQLGVDNPEIRKSMLKDFAQMPNQCDHYDKIIANTDGNKYNDQVLNNIWAHLINLKTSLSIAMLELHVKPLENNLVNHRLYSSTIVQRILNEIERQTYNIEELLHTIENRKYVPSKTLAERKPKSIVKTIFFIGAVSIGIGILLCRYGRPRFPTKPFYYSNTPRY